MYKLTLVLVFGLTFACVNTNARSWEGNEFCVTTAADILNKYGEPEDRQDRYTGEVQYILYAYEKIGKGLPGVRSNYEKVSFSFGSPDGTKGVLYEIRFRFSESNYPKNDLIQLGKVLSRKWFGENHETFIPPGSPQLTFRPRGEPGGGTSISVTWGEFGNNFYISYFDCAAGFN